MTTAAATIVLAALFYAGLAGGVELLETARERARGAVLANVVVTTLPRRNALPMTSRRALDFVQAAALVGVATLVSSLLRGGIFAPEDVVMLHLAAVMIVALRFGRAAAVFAAALAVAAYDFLFVPPRLTFF